ncbi:MAG: phosphoribosyltransferase [Caldimonas sp.]|uniref:phosphoribosyltransferase n=1 Tax=Caldimonas taiwanensis TaxID=307483 RepID=UPI000782C3C4|nr:phosphoribosyltransferase family protein [Caldimonas taiwanensis]GIX25183.1 MAG: phosphoribosyltransferase [Caldimonas sp.]
MESTFTDRRQAGERLADQLGDLRDRHPVVLALPRGGVLVAAPIAQRLQAALDVLLVRKIGAPGQPELAVAAVVEGQPPHMVVDEALCRDTGADARYLADQERDALQEIERRRALYRHGRPLPPLGGRTVIVVDDGLATGTTMKAALRGLRPAQPAAVILAVPVAAADSLAVPVAAADSLAVLARQVDRIVCLSQPSWFRGVGAHYLDFHQVPDAEVLHFLAALKRTDWSNDR